MATLVLTAVGAAVGGPIGAAVGAVVGQQIDARLFAPKARHGPRLGELAVQTSSYGSVIPKIFGRMRVAGTVIWATDLQEHRNRSGGGKGRPKTVDYSYSASFAVALSARSIRSVGRIWADGKLLRGAGGDFKTETTFRAYLGDEDQEPDPLIAAAEGVGEAPAYRGIAYAVFENLQLADFGNRIPSLSFELEADEGPVSIAAIAEALSNGALRGGETPALAGYAASGDGVRGALETLGEVIPLSLVDDGANLHIATAAGVPIDVEDAEASARAAASSGGRTEVMRLAATSVPSEVSLVYYDPSRDYQTGLQRTTRGGASAGSGAPRSERKVLPAALSAETAKGLAEHRLAALWAGRSSASLHLGWRRSDVRPGGLVRLQGQPGLWKIEGWSLERMVLGLKLVRMRTGMAAAAAATPGRPVAEPDLPHGPTTVRLLDLPLYGELAADRPQLVAAAAGASPGWRRANLTISYDGGTSWEAAGSTAAPAVLGLAVTALEPGSASLLDLKGSVVVELLGEAMWLESRSDDALANGANLALIGNELIQFGAVEPLGGRRFRLTKLLRGRRGTEWANVHLAGEPFVVIERASLAVIEPPPATLGGEAQLLAVGIGDADEGASANCAIGGAATRPPSPAHLRAETLADGDVRIGWVRRSRAGWSWLSGSDTPLGEESESYRLTISGASFLREVTVGEPVYLYTAAQQAEDGATGSFAVGVVQVGTTGASRATTLHVG